MLVPELEEFARAVGESRPPANQGYDVRRVLQVLDAVVEPDRQGRFIDIE